MFATKKSKGLDSGNASKAAIGALAFFSGVLDVIAVVGLVTASVLVCCGKTSLPFTAYYPMLGTAGAITLLWAGLLLSMQIASSNRKE